MLLRTGILASIIFCLISCEKIAILSTPKKQPKASHTELAHYSERVFWNTLHEGNYFNLDHTIELLTAAYLQNPHDPKLAAHLGFAHIWKITERNQLKTIPASIVNEIILARKYFADAIELEPQDARYQGFFGDSQLVEGKIFNDERTQVSAYFQLQRAIHMWPEFNYFTAGYPMSTLPPSDKNFKEGLEWQWKTLTLCAGRKITANNPDFSPYLARETQSGPKRACWNSWIAPHNFEGFFLNMGDMLVKNGQWQTAIQIYGNAKLSLTYDSWPFKNMLENRIKNARNNVANFNSSSNNMAQISDAERTILFNSGYGCAICHQKS